MQRQVEGHIPPFPIWDDVRTFDGHKWRGIVDVVSGGFPCQDISPAGKRVGISGASSGLWSEMARVIGEVMPHYAFIENSSQLVSRGLNVVLRDLASMGMDARWGVFSSCRLGAPHTRDRLFIVANSKGKHGKERLGSWAARTWQVPEERYRSLQRDRVDSVERNAGSGSGHPYRVDRGRAIGNGQDPVVVANAWRTLSLD